uniref:Phosphatidate cytidylyltransferase n=1 Tax=Cyanothece sp. (strain PCC 7425 / ATCC 29141) TaxID=395961 RepID=B8HTR7_CYAP4
MFPESWLSLAPDLAGPIAIVAGWLGIVLLLAESVHRFTNLGTEVSRKIVHIGTGNVILLAWGLRLPAWLGIAASLLFSLLTLISYRYPVLPSVSGVGRKSWGTFFYAVSIGILIACFWQQDLYQYAVLGILIMTWGDGLAALVGRRFGHHPYNIWGMGKSWEGSLTMAAITVSITALLLFYQQGNLWQTWCIALITAGVATGLEAFSRFGIDNLTVPLGSALVCYGLEQLLV